MNILLVEPRYYTASIHHYFPIGPAYIASVLKQDGHTVHGINANSFSGSMAHVVETLLDKMKQVSYDAVAMGGLCTTYEFQKGLFNEIKKRHPGVTLVSGGNLFSSEPRFCYDNFQVDYGIKGEGEIPCSRLFQAIETQGPIDDIPGIVYRREGTVYENKGTCVKEVDTIPFPDWEMFVPAQTLRQAGSMPIFTSRSCPFNCTFCYHPKESHYRRRPVENVAEEIELLVGNYQISHLMINDELFALDPEWTEDFCKVMATYKGRVSWGCQIRVTSADRELLSLMKASGCIQVTAGFESGSDTVLQSMKKKATVSQAERAVSIIRAAGFNPTGGVILGDFAETGETISETVAFIKRNALVPFADIGMVVPYPGSAIYERCLAEGLITDKELFLKKLGTFSKLKVNMTAMDDETLLFLQEKASREVYLWFLSQFCAQNVSRVNGSGTSLEFSCPTCQDKGTLTDPGMKLETIVSCEACCHPVMIHPKNLPALSEKINRFESEIMAIDNWEDVVITPVGHESLRLSALMDLPVERIMGFMDGSRERLGQPFLGKPVFARDKEIINRLSPKHILVISTQYGNDIEKEIRRLINTDQQLTVF